jgi:hypothetical protein
VNDQQPIVRYAARAIVIDDAGRTLLFRAAVPGREPAFFIWITPGGGIVNQRSSSGSRPVAA